MRVFKRLETAYNACTAHPFFLERIAYAQWNNKPSFISGPNIAVDHTNYWRLAGKIGYSMDYYMKSHTMAVFGHNINPNLYTNQSLLARTWLHCTADTNHLLLFVEPINPETDIEYMISINNCSWMPTEKQFTDKSISEFRQTVSLDTNGRHCIIQMTPLREPMFIPTVYPANPIGCLENTSPLVSISDSTECCYAGWDVGEDE